MVAKHGFAVYIQIVNPSAPLTDGKRSAGSIQFYITFGFLLLHACLLSLQYWILIRIQHKLLASQHLSLLDEWLSILGLELEDYKQFLIAVVPHHLCDNLLHLLACHHLALLWSDTTDVHLATMAECDACRTIATMMMPTCSSTAYKPLQLKVVECLEEVLVVNLELAVLQSLVLYPYVLVVVLHLVSMWVQTAVGGNDTVTVKVVVGSRIASVVATICKDLLTCNLALVAQSLVNKVPDVTTLIFGVLTDDVPILFESTH